MKIRFLLLHLFFLCFTSLTFAQENGKLQIHFIDVGQRDGAVLISPKGEVVLFDNGVQGLCDKLISYVQQLGVTRVNYHIASHYHSDHIGCTAEVLREFPFTNNAVAYNHGAIYTSSTFERYLRTVSTRRKEATPGTVITLDRNFPNPMPITLVALNGDEVVTTNLSRVAKISLGNFDAVIGGDLSGFKTEYYEDTENSVAQVEVYKVHHHGSRYSSAVNWLKVVKPLIGIISTGDGNDCGHPTQECMERLHAHKGKTYRTESGNGAEPAPGYDIVGWNIIVEAAPGSQKFAVTHSGAENPSFITSPANMSRISAPAT